MRRLPPTCDTRARSASTAASAYARASTAAGSQTSCTSPIRSAVAASTSSPVSRKKPAQADPTTSTSRAVEAAP